MLIMKRDYKLWYKMNVANNKANITKEALHYLKAKAYVVKLKEKKELDANSFSISKETSSKKKDY